MPEMDPKLEAFIHDRLRRLPPRSAPASLVPGVMAAIQARHAVPWWRQAWWHWPLAAQVALVTIALAALGLVCGGSVILPEGLSTYGPVLADRVGVLSIWWGNLTAYAQGPSAYWTQSIEPLLLPALVGVVALYVVSMGCGTALVRLVIRRE